MNKVAIFEIYDHHHHVISQYKVLSSLGYDVTIYCSKRVRNLLSEFFDSDHSIKRVVQADREPLIIFLYRTKFKVDRDFDLIWINTVQGHAMWKFYFTNYRKPTVISNGRLSEWFNRNYRFTNFQSLRDFVYHNYSTFLTHRLKQRYRAMIFHTPQAVKFANAHGFTKPCCLLPFSVYRSGSDKQEQFKTTDKLPDRVINFVLTGSINNKARDHLGFLNSLEKLDKNTRSRLKLTILSKFQNDEHSKNVWERVSQLRLSGFMIATYGSWIDDREYEKVISHADLICSPIRVEDYYSCGELTSAMVTSIEHGIPALYQSRYKPDPALVPASFYYEDLSVIHRSIYTLINNPDLIDNAKYQLRAILQTYNQKKSARNIALLLNQVLDK